MLHLEEIKSEINEVFKIWLVRSFVLASQPVKEASCTARDFIILTLLTFTPGSTVHKVLN